MSSDFWPLYYKYLHFYSMLQTYVYTAFDEGNKTHQNPPRQNPPLQGYI